MFEVTKVRENAKKSQKNNDFDVNKKGQKFDKF